MTAAQEANNKATEHIKALAKQFIERQAELGYKGKRRDGLAIEFFVGAANTALVLGDILLTQRLTALLNFDLCINGYRTIERLTTK